MSIAAYNGGEGAVRRARARAKANGRGTDFWSIRPYLPRETQAYVPRLLAVAAVVRAPSRFKLSLADIPNQPYFTIVPLQGQLDLGVAAQTAGIKIKQMQRLNPGFRAGRPTLMVLTGCCCQSRRLKLSRLRSPNSRLSNASLGVDTRYVKVNRSASLRNVTGRARMYCAKLTGCRTTPFAQAQTYSCHRAYRT